MSPSNLRVGDLVTHAYKGVNSEYSVGVVLSTKNTFGLIKVFWASGRESFHVHYMLKWLA